MAGDRKLHLRPSFEIAEATLTGKWSFVGLLRQPCGVCEAHLHQIRKPCAIGAMPSQTHGNVWWCKRKQTTIIHADRFVMALLQWHMVYKLGEDELRRAPVAKYLGSFPYMPKYLIP